jgi:hypothetical protein
VSRIPGHPETDERRAAELLSELLSKYGIVPDSVSSQNGLRRMFKEKWATLANVAHMLHDAQERRNHTQASELEDEMVSG